MMLVVDCLSFEVLKLQARQKNNFCWHKMAQTMLSYIFFQARALHPVTFLFFFCMLEKIVLTFCN